MKLIKELIIGSIFLVIILLLEKYDDFDIHLQNLFFNSNTNEWMINSHLHKRLNIFFYNGLKTFTISTGILCILGLCASVKIKSLQAYHKPMLILFLSIIFVPAIVASAKYITNVYCPYQLDIYNGFNPFVRIIDSYPEGFIQLKPGRCFPAGHATAGFAFMALFFCFDNKQKRIIGLLFGITIGLMAGTYQMLRGQHFLSHSLFSMVASFMVISIINYLVTRQKTTKNHS